MSKKSRKKESSVRNGGVDIRAKKIDVKGDITGRDKITQTYTAGLTGDDLSRLFQPLMASINEIPSSEQAAVLQKVEELKQELTKGKKADDSRVAKLLDAILSMVPGAVGAVVTMFGQPVLGAMVGPATKFVLDKIQGK